MVMKAFKPEMQKAFEYYLTTLYKAEKLVINAFYMLFITNFFLTQIKKLLK